MNNTQIISLMLDSFNNTPYHQHIGLQFSYQDKHGLQANFSRTPELLGNQLRKMLHGGLISSVFDALGGVLCSIELIDTYKKLEQKQAIRKLNRLCTIDLNLNYHAPAKAEHFYATGHIVHQGSSIFHVHMKMFDNKQTLIASANANYMY